MTNPLTLYVSLGAQQQNCGRLIVPAPFCCIFDLDFMSMFTAPVGRSLFTGRPNNAETSICRAATLGQGQVATWFGSHVLPAKLAKVGQMQHQSHKAAAIAKGTKGRWLYLLLACTITGRPVQRCNLSCSKLLCWLPNVLC